MSEPVIPERKPIPGPWEATERFTAEVCSEANVWGPDGDCVAYVCGNLGLDGDALATAQLIARAPDLEAKVAEQAATIAEITNAKAQMADEFQATARRLRAVIDEHEKLLKAATHGLRSYQYGNSSTELAESMADAIDAALSKQELSNGR